MCNCEKNNQLLSSPNISLNQLIEAFTDPKKRFEFPIKPATIDLSKETKIVIISAALILGGALIYNATRR
jgi:hypothetical protein